MPIRVIPSPRECLLKVVKEKPGSTRSEAARLCGVTYWSSRYHLEKLVKEKFLRKEILWTIRHFVRRIFYYPVVKEIVDATIVVYSVCTGKRGEYKYRFQGFYDVDALRDVTTGVISYDAELTVKEIEYCMFDFRLRWGWYTVGLPAPGVEEPVWVETSEFERITEPKGVVCKSLSKIEDGEETYFSTIMKSVFVPTEEDIKRFMETVE